MERLSLTQMCCEVGARAVKLLWGKMRRETVGVALQVLTKTVCSLVFNLQHHWTRSLWRCCQTTECLRPCTPGTFFLEQSGEFWVYSIFYPCQSLFNIRFTVFFWFWSHKCLRGRSVHLASYHFVVHLELAKSKETSIVQFEHHFPVRDSNGRSVREYY